MASRSFFCHPAGFISPCFVCHVFCLIRILFSAIHRLTPFERKVSLGCHLSSLSTSKLSRRQVHELFGYHRVSIKSGAICSSSNCILTCCHAGPFHQLEHCGLDSES